MLSLNRKTDYALVALAALAGDGTSESTPLSVRRVAETYSLPVPLMMNVLKELQRAGLVRSTRGARGGYRLARSADEISLAAIIAAIEGPVRLTLCSEDRERPEETRCVSCTLVQRCPVTTGIRTVNDRIVSFLRQVTLQDLLRCELEGFPELHQVSTPRRLSIGIPRP